MQREEISELRGGLDMVTPAISVPPGKVISAQNYEPVDEGYRRLSGFEAFDGRPAPSAAGFWVMDFDAGETAITAGQTLTGGTSGATGIALYDATVESGDWGDSDAAGYVVLYNVAGTFSDGEDLEVSASKVAEAASTAIQSGAATDADATLWTEAAIAARRAVIAAVPGSGPIRGVATFKGDVYAWRDNVGATALVMHKATTSGWAAQSFGKVLDFDAGTAAFTEGETVTGSTTSHNGVIERVVLMSGDWSTNDAAGYLVLSSAANAFQDNETITSAAGSARADGTAAAITLPAGGRVRTINHNFYGTSDLFRMYGVTSTGRAFEWDGAVLAPIRTGLSDALDKPKHIGVHANHLLLGYDGGSIMRSATGEPLNYSGLDLAGEFGIGEPITGIVSAAYSATAIFGRNVIAYLTGTVPGASGDMVLNTITREAGAIADSAVMADEPIYLDGQGVRRLSSAEQFGDWKVGTLTRMVQPWLDSQRNSGAVPVGAHVVRGKDQYRLYYDDGAVLVIFLGRGDPEILPFELDLSLTCTARGEGSDGQERLFLGDASGWVYEMDKGRSFNGEDVDYFLRFPWRHQGGPNREKRYHGLNIEVRTLGTSVTLRVSAEYSYADDEVFPAADAATELPGSGGIWDVSDWDAFRWDTRLQQPLRVDLDAIGENISYVLLGASSVEEPHTLSSDTIFYTMRRQKRRRAA